MPDAELRSLLKEEYLRIQAFTESFDKLAMTVKAWSVTFSLAALVGASTSHRSIVVLIAAVSSLGFWMTETYVRVYQYSYYDRLSKIEEYFRNPKKSIHPLQTGSSWSAKFAKIGAEKLLRISFWPEVFLPHIIPFLLAIVLYILSISGKLAL